MDYPRAVKKLSGDCPARTGRKTSTLPPGATAGNMSNMAPRPPSLEEVFSPRSIAVVGVSGSGRNFASGVLVALKEAGFPRVYPVNPRHAEVLGVTCYPGLLAIPDVVDHVVVSIPAESVLALLDECATKGVRSVHFFTAGFSESGEAERARLEQAMLEKARQGGFRILGPNCIGMAVPARRVTNTPGIPLEPGPVAFISQSGGHASNLPQYGGPRGLRFSKIVSYGNGLDIDESELLEYLATDPATGIIAVYIEGVRDGRRFRTALEKAAAVKPVVIYKGGTTGAGQRAAHGHTASLTSSVAVFQALCHQAGAILTDDFEELLDVVVALRFVRPVPASTGVAIVGAGGGPSVLASDEVEKAGLAMPQTTPAVRAELMRALPLAGSIFANPIDAPNLATPEAITATVQVLSRVPEIGAFIYHLGFHPISSWGGGRFAQPSFLQPVTTGLKQVWQTSGKPVLMALRPGLNLEEMKDFLAVQEALVAAGFPVFHSLRQAARALARVIAWHRRRDT